MKPGATWKALYHPSSSLFELVFDIWQNTISRLTKLKLMQIVVFVKSTHVHQFKHIVLKLMQIVLASKYVCSVE